MATSEGPGHEMKQSHGYQAEELRQDISESIASFARVGEALVQAQTRARESDERAGRCERLLRAVLANRSKMDFPEARNYFSDSGDDLYSSIMADDWDMLESLLYPREATSTFENSDPFSLSQLERSLDESTASIDAIAGGIVDNITRSVSETEQTQQVAQIKDTPPPTWVFARVIRKLQEATKRFLSRLRLKKNVYMSVEVLIALCTGIAFGYMYAKKTGATVCGVDHFALSGWGRPQSIMHFRTRRGGGPYILLRTTLHTGNVRRAAAQTNNKRAGTMIRRTATTASFLKTDGVCISLPERFSLNLLDALLQLFADSNTPVTLHSSSDSSTNTTTGKQHIKSLARIVDGDISKAVDGCSSIVVISDNMQGLREKEKTMLVNASKLKVPNIVHLASNFVRNQDGDNFFKELANNQGPKATLSTISHCTLMQEFFEDKMLHDMICGGVISLPVSPLCRVSYVDASDVADAVGHAISRKTSYEKTLVTGPEALELKKVAHVFESVLGRPTRFSSIPLWAVKPSLWIRGYDPDMIGAFLRKCKYLDQGGEDFVTNTVHAPRTLWQFVFQNQDRWKVERG